MRSAVDRFVAFLARLATRGLFRSVEVIGFDELPTGPRLMVVNHFNGFVDPVVLAGALGRLPRFIAKATLWKVPMVPVLMRVAGVLPVHRQADGGGDNRSTFGSVIDVLHRGGTVAIFPEGTTHDQPHLAELRTGAARLALDAAADAVKDLRIVPVGLTFEDKVALRSRVVIQAGRPIDPADGSYLDGSGAPTGSGDHDAVHRLTQQVRVAIAEVSPDFTDLLDATEMRRAADVALRSEGLRPLQEVGLAEREQLAKDLDRLPQDQRDPIARSAGEYQLLLGAVGIDDSYLKPRVTVRALVGRAVVTALAVVVLAPFALVGLVVNAIPALLVTIAGLAATAPVSKGTNRVLVGLVSFPVMWWAVAARDAGRGSAAELAQAATWPLDPLLASLFASRGGFGPSLVVFLLCPVFGLLAVGLAEQFWRLWRTVRAVSTTMNRRGQVDGLLERRAQLVGQVAQATGGAASARSTP
jgi:1-acyl-sn-glycerol-3-phosphate acyltransferase